MRDYQPLDLSTLCNTGAEVFGSISDPPAGEQQFWGLPFQVGAASPSGNRYIGFGSSDGLKLDPVTVSIGQTARRVLFAHTLLESRLNEGGAPRPVGQPVAHYVFRYADGEEQRVPIRERFEVAVVPTGWGQLAFLAVP